MGHLEWLRSIGPALAHRNTAEETAMSLKDKLEVGLKPDAPFRPDNLPDFQKDDKTCEVAATPGDSPELQRARAQCEEPPEKEKRRRRSAGAGKAQP
jgi:hypothetical protein